MSTKPMAQIRPVKKTQAQIEAEAGMAEAARAAMFARAEDEAHEAARVEAIAQVMAEAEEQSRQERIARGWKVREDALWNPFEVTAFIGMIIFAFGFLLGRDHFFFAVELFFPVILTGIVVLVLQAALRRKAGERGVLSLMRDRIR